jgi:hypothetical protein
MNSVHLISAMAIGALTGCGGTASLYSAELFSYETEFSLGLPGEEVELSHFTVADSNGRDPYRINRGEWRTTLFPNWGHDGVMSRTWNPPRISFPMPAPDEERTALTIRMGGEEGVAIYEHTTGPFSVEPVGVLRAGEPVHAQLFTGTADVHTEHLGGRHYLMLQQGEQVWTLDPSGTEGVPPPAGTFSLRDRQLRFTLPPDVQPGQLHFWLPTVRTPVVIDCRGFQRCTGRVFRMEAFELTVE